MNRTIVLLLGLGMAMLSIAGPSVRDEVALRDSLSRVHSRIGERNAV